jgi:hypothetical protein
MKNLLIYINPKDKKFSKEHDDLTKIQIDNALELGWRPEDILLVTNFPYEYRGIKSIIVDDYSVFDQDRSTKIPAINELFKRDLIEDNEVYWFHDHDAFQLVPFDIKLDKDTSFSDHGAFSKVWNAGSFFFKKSSKDIFIDIWKIMSERNWNEQNSLTYIWTNNINNINDRYVLLDPSYNLGIYKIPENIKLSKLPIKVAHFHPHKKHHIDRYREILPERLLTIFNNYGIN